MISIKHQPKSLRPRERLAEHGVECLQTSELLTILLGSGSSRIPVQQLAKKIEKLFEEQKKVELKDLMEVKGIGLAKACQIVSAIELVERISPRFPDEILNSLDKVLQVLSELRFLQREQVVGLYLDARLKLIHKEVLSIGSVNQNVIAPRDVFSPIKHLPVVFIILSHNHPSGEVSPSQDDIEFTRNMQDAGKILGVELIDHVIIAKHLHYSFKQAGRL